MYQKKVIQPYLIIEPVNIKEMVNNSSNINKTNNHLSHQLIDHKNDVGNPGSAEYRHKHVSG